MNLLFFCPRWGSEIIAWDEFCGLAKYAGYHGIEASLPANAQEEKDMQQALLKHNLLFIGQYWQSLEKDFEPHKISYREYLYRLGSFNPLKIDAQTGKDYFSFEQNKELFLIADAFTKDTGIVVAHETHRNKALFAAHITRHFLNQVPGLQITADFSHWCVVAESFSEDQQDALELAAQHANHIHARVGHTQAAQVPDPRLPEWEGALKHHLKWWRLILNFNFKKNTAPIYHHSGIWPCTLHAGTPRYKRATGKPVGDQCMDDELFKKFAECVVSIF